MQTFTVHKSAVHSRHGLVAAQNRHAAEAGAAVLAQGGNAMDAAIVTALVLSVVEPWLSGIGGGGFLLHADGKTGAVDTLDFNVLAPQGLNPADYPLVGGNDGDWFNWPAVQGNRNVAGYSAICVPGAIAGFASALQKYGTLSWAEALQPAIHHATQGLELDWFTCLTLAIDAAGLAQDPASAALFLDAGRAPRAGDRTPVARRPMPDKARLLQRLAEAGPREFYEGETARALARDLEAGGSALRFADFANYQPIWQSPLVGNYRGQQILTMAGLSGGPTLLAACDMLTASDLGPSSSSAEAALIHATAIRAAYEQRLTSMGHAATAEAGCTSHVSVVDASGSMVSLTNTLLSRFGAKVVMPSGGFLMNNGMMWFDPRPGQPNSIAAGAKPLANMCPLILQRDGRPWLALGAAGGRTIVPTLLQLLAGLLDRGLSLEDAFAAPRLDASTSTIKVDQRAGPEVAAAVGSRFPVEVVQDTVYPVQFAIPSAVLREGASNQGMTHPTSPWAAVAIGGADHGV